jgi:hypothetical protein
VFFRLERVPLMAGFPMDQALRWSGKVPLMAGFPQGILPR